ncbi:endoribonuclease Dcr-1-like [Tropilaelaps mercedesae]|uniref:Endoribonuclease Dcr-1-like n=1 Tax=Tropilaelaps mercedesae TaxID=418985 RepID=A0A1V9XTR9_9ACAR|nr:endoribonuclease Dcr-1-like [Tropilaelaps mercedesae]
MVLEYIIKRVLIMNSQSNFDGSTLNNMATALLKADTVAFIAVKNKLEVYLFIDQIHMNNSKAAKFREVVEGFETYQMLVTNITEPKLRPSPGAFLHRMMKALIGAVYVDTGYNIQATDDVIMPMFKAELNEVYNKALHNKEVL